MASRPDPDATEDVSRDTGGVSDDSPAPGTPRWVKIFGLIALVLILVVAVLLLAGGEHGPRRHVPAGGIPSPAWEGTGRADTPASPGATHRAIEVTVG